jgi:hypothetical protein
MDEQYRGKVPFTKPPFTKGALLKAVPWVKWYNCGAVSIAPIKIFPRAADFWFPWFLHEPFFQQAL